MPSLKPGQILIAIGHGAYTRGTNFHRMCFSKVQAVRVLMNRGVDREQARKVIKEILTKPNGSEVVNISTGVVEIKNEAERYSENVFYDTYEEMRKYWRNKSEL